MLCRFVRGMELGGLRKFGIINRVGEKSPTTSQNGKFIVGEKSPTTSQNAGVRSRRFIAYNRLRKLCTAART
jgi:hypothetical protein